jgi:hypothetical protein
MRSSAKMVIEDPSKFGLLATQVKLDLIQGGIATVNVMAGRTRKGAVKNAKEKFINRNTFTARQIQFTPMAESKYIKLSAVCSSVGATEKVPYMKRQEEGGKHTPAKGRTLAIPTDVARGGSKHRPVAADMRLKKIKGRRRIRDKKGNLVQHNKARNVARALVAFNNNLFIPIGEGEERNLFLVKEFYLQKVAKGKGSAERMKHRKVAFKLEQVYKFSQPETTTDPEPWLLPASQDVAKQVQAIFNAQMKKLEK